MSEPNLKVQFKRATPLPNAAKIEQQLQSIVGPENVSTDAIDKLAYGKDYLLISNRWTLDGIQPTEPDFIVWPKTVEQVSAIVKYANEQKIPVIPYGEGSGVVGGALAVNGGIIVDMKYFQDLDVNRKNMTVTVGTGWNGQNLERTLNEQGLTMGHIPQSVRTSTVGGYIAHRAAGQFSTKYGKMEDIVLAMEVVLPTGEIIRTKSYPRASVGPMIDKLFLGGEGTMGIVTKAVCRIWPAPERRALLSFAFDNLSDCLNAIRETLQGQIFPAVIRIYDKIETERHFYNMKEAKNKLMVIFVCEGPKYLVDVEERITAANCKKFNGLDCGEEPVHHWFETRFTVKESSEYAPMGLVFDTIEVACMWDVADKLYENTIKSMMSVPGMLMGSAHASHFYTTGVCFYFTFGGNPQPGQDPYEFYKAVWDATMRGVLSVNGTISHHHGLGINRTPWMKEEYKEVFDVLVKVKNLLDPNKVLNPGKLYDEQIRPFQKK
jgi:alkyldihydroxyacetonephosphate synthase